MLYTIICSGINIDKTNIDKLQVLFPINGKVNCDKMRQDSNAVIIRKQNKNNRYNI